MNKGFSLIEILIAIAIIVTLVILVLVSFSGLSANKTLIGSAEETVSLIKEARSKTFSSKESSQYGIHFETSRIVLFKGDTFSEPNPDNIEVTINSLVEISDISLNDGGNDLVFQRLTGKTNEFGSITFRLKNDISKTKIITINSSGIIDTK